MAISKTISIKGGQISVENAYLKITGLGINENCNVCISAFFNKAAADNALEPLDNYSETFTPVYGDGVDDIKRQAYKHIKTLQAYSDAVDC